MPAISWGGTWPGWGWLTTHYLWMTSLRTRKPSKDTQQVEFVWKALYLPFRVPKGPSVTGCQFLPSLRLLHWHFNWNVLVLPLSFPSDFFVGINDWKVKNLFILQMVFGGDVPSWSWFLPGPGSDLSNFIATRSPQKVVKSKGILPKMAETFRFRIYFIKCPEVMWGVEPKVGVPQNGWWK